MRRMLKSRNLVEFAKKLKIKSYKHFKSRTHFRSHGTTDITSNAVVTAENMLYAAVSIFKQRNNKLKVFKQKTITPPLTVGMTRIRGKINKNTLSSTSNERGKLNDRRCLEVFSTLEISPRKPVLCQRTKCLDWELDDVLTALPPILPAANKVNYLSNFPERTMYPAKLTTISFLK